MEKKDYKDTLNLPATEFPMKANLPKREPEMLKRWEDEGLYEKMLEKNRDKPSYILHDGPRTPTATYTWATLSTRCSRTLSSSTRQ